MADLEIGDKSDAGNGFLEVTEAAEQSCECHVCTAPPVAPQVPPQTQVPPQPHTEVSIRVAGRSACCYSTIVATPSIRLYIVIF